MNQKYVIILFFVFNVNFLISQSEILITINNSNQELTINKKLFRVGKYIKITIDNYDPDDNRYTVDYEAVDYIDDEMVKKFSSYTNSTPKVSATSSKYDYLPIQVENKDFSILRIKRFKKGDETPSEERTYKFKNYGSIKFDVSSGFFISKNYDEKYSLYSVLGGPVGKKIIRDDNGSLKVGIGILAHLHSRTKYMSNFGICGGFEVSNDAKIGYLAGGSMLFGPDKKFVFSSGVLLSKIKVISSLYKEGDLVDQAINEIPMKEIWMASLFGSFTYNF